MHHPLGLPPAPRLPPATTRHQVAHSLFHIMVMIGTTFHWLAVLDLLGGWHPQPAFGMDDVPRVFHPLISVQFSLYMSQWFWLVLSGAEMR